MVNFMWKDKEREAENIVLLIFLLWWYFNCLLVRDGGWGRKSHLGPAEIISLSRPNFSKSNKNDTFQHGVSTGCFYVLFLQAVAASNFHPLNYFFK